MLLSLPETVLEYCKQLSTSKRKEKRVNVFKKFLRNFKKRVLKKFKPRMEHDEVVDTNKMTILKSFIVFCLFLETSIYVYISKIGPGIISEKIDMGTFCHIQFYFYRKPLLFMVRPNYDISYNWL